MKWSVILLAATACLGGCATVGHKTSVAAATPAEPCISACPAAQSELYLGVVEGLIRQGRYQAAIAFLAKYQKTGTPTPRFRELTADALNGAGRYDEAIASYRTLLTSSYAAAAYNGMGRAQSGQGNWPAAEQSFRQAAMLDPANATYLNNMGYASLGQNRAGAELYPAVDALSRAHELLPDSGLIQANLALAEARAGERQQLAVLLQSVSDAKRRRQLASFVADWKPAPQQASAAVPAKDAMP